MLPTTHVTLQSVPVNRQALSTATTIPCMYHSLQSCPDDGCKTVVLIDTLDSDFVICLAGSAPLYLLLCSRERLL